MKDNRKPGLSLLDYLWETLGGYEVTDKVTSTPSIPSTSLVLELIQTLNDKSVGSVSSRDGELILYNLSGFEISRVDVSELGSVTVVDFGQKIVQQSDIDNGCPFLLNTPVYYITLSNNKQFWTKKDVLRDYETSTIKNLIINNSVVSSLKIDKRTGNVVLTTDNGLKAILPVTGLQDPIKFQFLTLEDYDKITNPILGTVYFIENESYFYFGSTKIGDVNDVDIFLIVTELPIVGKPNKIYLLYKSENQYTAYVYVNNVALLVGNVGGTTVDQLETRIDDIENTLTWKEL